MSNEPSISRGGRRSIAWWQIALFGLMVIMFIMFAAGLGRDGKFIPSPLIGKPAFQFDIPKLAKLEATPEEKSLKIKLADFKGKVVVMNFWASWCVSCRQEHHVLLEAANVYVANGGVQFLGINHKDTDKAANTFLDSMGRFPYPSGIDRQGRLALEFGVYGMPETFFINAEGVVAAKHIGPLTMEVMHEKLKIAGAVR